MKVTAERIPESKVILRIEIPPEQVVQALEKTFRDLSQRVRVPGFRPGKAPRPLVERYLGGSETVQREGIDRLIDDSYRKALRETDTHAIGDPDLSERPEFHPGEPLVIEATVPVSPHVELGDYLSVRMQPLAVEATYEMVNRYVDELVERNATWEKVDRGARDHDKVLIDVVGVAGTVPVLYGPGGETLVQSEGGREAFNVTGHEHNLDVAGPVEFAPGFDEELIGLMADSNKRFGLTLPADFADATLANQSIVFTVKVHEVKEKHVPVVDDEFAKKVGGGETVEELRDAVRLRIQLRLEREARSLYENALVDAVVSRSTIEIPEVLIEQQIDLQLEDFKSELATEKITWQDYLDRTKSTEQKARDDLRESAIRTLRGYLVLREVARREGIQVTPAEVLADIDSTAAQFGRARSVVRERLNTREQRERIESRLFFSKAVALLSEIAERPAPLEEASPSVQSTEAEPETELTPATTVERLETTEQAVAAADPESESTPAAEALTTEETLTHG